MSAPSTTFACPGCAASLVTGTPRCEHCRIRLTGELALQLWRLDQQMAVLQARRTGLVTALRRDDADDVLPSFATPSSPGTETRRILLGLGAVCLIAALTAGTALIWPALGVGGQTSVLLIVTAALMAGALRLQHRLPATGDAIGAVGVAAAAVDLVAGRRLVAPDLSGAASHAYWFFGSVVVCAVLGYVGSRARRLHSPTVGAVLASYGAVVALVSPASADDTALVGLLGAALSVVILRTMDRLPVMRTSARTTAFGGAAAFLVLGAGASLVSADGRGLGLLCGLALSVAFPVVMQPRWWGAAGGVLASALLLRAEVVPLGAWALVTAGVSASVLTVAAVAEKPSCGWVRAAAFVGSGAALTEAAAQRSLQSDAIVGTNLIDAAVGLAIVALVCALRAWLSRRLETSLAAAAGATFALSAAVAEAFGTGGVQLAADSTAVVASAVFILAATTWALAIRTRDVALATAVSATAGAIAAVAVDVSLAWRVVTTAEAFVIAPAVVAGVMGVLAMRRLTGLSSWVLFPALLVMTAPTLLLALDGDLNRQVVVLAAAAMMVAVGAQRRLVCPLTVGAVEIVLVVGRILGPEIQQLPRWLTLGVLGAVLIGLGSTWEQRLKEVRRAAERMRPSVAALR